MESIEVKLLKHWDMDGDEEDCGIALVNRKTRCPLPCRFDAFEDTLTKDPSDDATLPEQRAEMFLQWGHHNCLQFSRMGADDFDAHLTTWRMDALRDIEAERLDREQDWAEARAMS